MEGGQNHGHAGDKIDACGWVLPLFQGEYTSCSNFLAGSKISSPAGGIFYWYHMTY